MRAHERYDEQERAQEQPGRDTADADQARMMERRHQEAVEKGEVPGENEAMKDLWWVKGDRVEDTSD